MNERRFAVAVALSLVAVACGRQDPTGASREPLARANPAVPAAPAPAAPARTEPKSADPPATVPVKAEKAEPVRKLAKSHPASTDAVLPDGLSVKRIVITRGIDKREPAAVERLVVSDEPLYAFVELANGSDSAAGVVITFEREGKSVGHVKLEVPAKNARWRTWGKTKQVRQAGDWVAVVRSADGAELGRKSFTLE